METQDRQYQMEMWGRREVREASGEGPKERGGANYAKPREEEHGTTPATNVNGGKLTNQTTRKAYRRRCARQSGNGSRAPEGNREVGMNRVGVKINGGEGRYGGARIKEG